MPSPKKSRLQRIAEGNPQRKKLPPEDPALNKGLVSYVAAVPAPPGLGVDGKRVWEFLATHGVWLSPADAMTMRELSRLADRIGKLERGIADWGKEMKGNPLCAGGELIAEEKPLPNGETTVSYKANPLARLLGECNRRFDVLSTKLGFEPGSRAAMVSKDPSVVEVQDKSAEFE